MRGRLRRHVHALRNLTSLARVAELADAGGLNPPDPRGSCGFEPHPGHGNQRNDRPADAHRTRTSRRLSVLCRPVQPAVVDDTDDW
jgi:hypothetical protein